MTRAVLIWAALSIALVVPIALAVTSPLLAWRDPVYIAAGFAGVVALALLLVQPLLAAGRLPGLPLAKSRRVHRGMGALLVTAVVLHVAGLWITSPPDVIDALTFTSPTPFSAWGVIAMWAIFATALLTVFRRRFHLRLWRLGHTTLSLIIVAGSAAHAMLIEGTMETLSKAALCALVIAVTLKVVIDLRAFVRPPSRRR